MKLILHHVKGSAGATLANQPCKAYICQMLIRFGLIPGAVDRARCGCNKGGPTKRCQNRIPRRVVAEHMGYQSLIRIKTRRSNCHRPLIRATIDPLPILLRRRF
jgi:hypothetical protein